MSINIRKQDNYNTEIIDVSEHNTVTNWNDVKASNVTGVMIRLAWAGWEGELHIDKKFYKHAVEANKAGLNIGVYVYSYCTTPKAAEIAAENVMNIVENYELIFSSANDNYVPESGWLNLPIAFDIEDENTYKNLNCNAIAESFCRVIEEHNFYPVVYSYTNFFKNHFNVSSITTDIWLADYTKEKIEECEKTLDKSVIIWQYIGNKGRCNGVVGAVDRNQCYANIPLEISKRFLNNLWYNPLTGGYEK